MIVDGLEPLDPTSTRTLAMALRGPFNSKMATVLMSSDRSLVSSLAGSSAYPRLGVLVGGTLRFVGKPHLFQKTFGSYVRTEISLNVRALGAKIMGKEFPKGEFIDIDDVLSEQVEQLVVQSLYADAGIHGDVQVFARCDEPRGSIQITFGVASKWRGDGRGAMLARQNLYGHIATENFAQLRKSLKTLSRMSKERTSHAWSKEPGPPLPASLRASFRRTSLLGDRSNRPSKIDPHSRSGGGGARGAPEQPDDQMVPLLPPLRRDHDQEHTTSRGPRGGLDSPPQRQSSRFYSAEDHGRHVREAFGSPSLRPRRRSSTLASAMLHHEERSNPPTLSKEDFLQLHKMATVQEGREGVGSSSSSEEETGALEDDLPSSEEELIANAQKLLAVRPALTRSLDEAAGGPTEGGGPRLAGAPSFAPGYTSDPAHGGTSSDVHSSEHEFHEHGRHTHQAPPGGRVHVGGPPAHSTSDEDFFSATWGPREGGGGQDGLQRLLRQHRIDKAARAAEQARELERLLKWCSATPHPLGDGVMQDWSVGVPDMPEILTKFAAEQRLFDLAQNAERELWKGPPPTFHRLQGCCSRCCRCCDCCCRACC